jgi:ABC-type nitrate/sulfonate/bicarbonate transport system permease component
MVLAVGAALAAGVIVAFSIPLYQSLTDPLGPLFQMTQNIPL